MQLKVFQIQEERNRSIIEERTKGLIGEGSNLVRASLKLFAKAVDSLYDIERLAAGQILPWQVAVSIEAARVYNQAEASLILLEKGYPIGSASCARSALESARLLVLMLVDEQAASDYTCEPGSKGYKRFTGKGIANEVWKTLKKYPQCFLCDKGISQLYGDLSQIAHPSRKSAIAVLRKSGDRTLLGQAYHPLEVSRIVWALLNFLIATSQDICIHRPFDAASLPKQLFHEGQALVETCRIYLETFRHRWLDEMKEDKTLRLMFNDYNSLLDRLQNPPIHPLTQPE
jgi:hypothetical protein